MQLIGNQILFNGILTQILLMEKFKELKDKRGTREYDLWFLKYSFEFKVFEI
jgi:hypothetical protein